MTEGEVQTTHHVKCLGLYQSWRIAVGFNEVITGHDCSDDSPPSFLTLNETFDTLEHTKIDNKFNSIISDQLN